MSLSQVGVAADNHNTGEPSAKPSDWAPVAALILIAFGFRVVLGYFFTYYGGDAPGYTRIAENLASGHGYSLAHHAPYVSTDVRLPGYPALLALSFLIRDSHWSAILLSALLGAASTLLVWLIARGLNLNRALALWTTAIAALFFCTASFAGVAQSENLSVPAVLAFVYVVLIRPPKSQASLFVSGSLLAWLVALTRDELVIFVALVAIVAARRAGLKVLGCVALLVCFLLGSGAWFLRNDVQVHRMEYVDSLMTDSVVVATLNGQNFDAPLYSNALALAYSPGTSNAQRSQMQHEVSVYAKKVLAHHFPTFARTQVKYYLESFFPVPIYGLTYTSSLLFLERLVWSVFLLAEYALALMTAVRWWKKGRRRDVVSIGLFPAFMAVFLIFLDPQPRFWLPAVLLLLPLAVTSVAGLTIVPPPRKANASATGGALPPVPSDR